VPFETVDCACQQTRGNELIEPADNDGELSLARRKLTFYLFNHICDSPKPSKIRLKQRIAPRLFTLHIIRPLAVSFHKNTRFS
jgi:hypothetical protein